jgi:hypothetical protein
VGVFAYMRPDGSVQRELRPPEEVFAPDSLKTLQHAPVTDLHPEVNGVRVAVTPENFKTFSIGHVAEEVKADGDHVAAWLLIQDAGAINLIDTGQRKENSCGYACDIDATPGRWPPTGEDYDVVQRKIRYNHVAIGPPGWGRGGSTVALRLDSLDAIQIDRSDSTMDEIIDGKSYKVGSPEWTAAKNAQITKLTAERDQALGRADAAETTNKTLKADLAKAVDPKAMADAITAKVKLVTDCRRVAMHVGSKWDAKAEEAAAAMGPEALIKAAILKLNPKAEVEGKSQDYLLGMFNMMIDSLPTPPAAKGPEGPEADKKAPEAPGAPAGAAGGAGAAPQKTDAKGGVDIFGARAGSHDAPAGTQKTDAADESDPDAARAAMVKKNQDRGTKPLASHRG